MATREEGLTAHRIVYSLEILIRGFEAIGLSPAKSVDLAAAHVIALEAQHRREREGPPMSAKLEVNCTRCGTATKYGAIRLNIGGREPWECHLCEDCRADLFYVAVNFADRDGHIKIANAIMRGPPAAEAETILPEGHTFDAGVPVTPI